MKRWTIGLAICLFHCGDGESLDALGGSDEALMTTVAPGITYGIRTYGGRQAHVVLINYALSNIDFRTTDAPTEAYARVSDWATHVPHAAVAINGGIWDRAHDGSKCWQTMAGLNIHDHDQYTKDGQFTSYLLVKDGKDVHMQTTESAVDDPGPAWKDAVSANTVLVANGHVVKCTDTNICPEVTHRTAVAINADKKLMWIVVTRTDMNLPELADFIANDTIAESAVNLDGGGSTTLWIKGKGVVNMPASEQRTVCNHFGILSN